MIALLTNDDGIHADGLNSLAELAEEFFDEVWVVAPATEMSQIGHRVTTDSSLQIEKRGEKRFAVHGTPADCTRVALAHLLPQKPDWVLSGINHGGNLGRHDFVISGTVAAVREAAFAGIKGIALSHYIERGLELDWSAATGRVRTAFEDLFPRALGAGQFWTVNLPHPRSDASTPKLVHCPQETAPLEVRYREEPDGSLQYEGDYQGRPRSEGTDVAVCFGGDVAISLASL